MENARPAMMPDGSWRIACVRTFDMEQIKKSMAMIEAKMATIGLGKVSVDLRIDESMVAAKEPFQGSGDAAAPLLRAEKILGGTSRFIKKKPATEGNPG